MGAPKLLIANRCRSKRLAQRAFGVPFHLKQSLVKGIKWNLGNFRPFTQRSSFASKCDHDRAALIAHLLQSGCPSNISWFVAFVVVYTVKFWGIWWRVPHFAGKYRDVMPRLMDSNTAPSVLSKMLVLWVVATLHHPPPSFINWRPAQSVNWLVEFGGIPNARFSQKAAAGHRVLRGKVALCGNLFVAALAKTFPSAPTVARYLFVDYGQSSKLLTDEVKFTHCCNLA